MNENKTEQTEKPAPLNPFFAIYGNVSFKAITGPDRTPYTFKTGQLAGTEQTSLAEVFVEMGNGRPVLVDTFDKNGKPTQIAVQIPTTDNFIDGGKIVMWRLPNGAVRFRLNWPSSGKDFKRPTIKAADENGERMMEEYKAHVVAEFKRWQKDRVKAGKLAQPSQAENRAGTPTTDQELADLGLA